MDVAIIIGCSSYDDAQIRPLRYADSDVASFAQAATATCGFPASSVTAFSSSSAEPSLQPTRRNILRFLSQGANVSAGEYVERLYFFFSGHGFKSVQDGTDYLLTRDSIANYPELNSIPLATVVSYLNGWGARNVVLFLDACRPFLEARKALQTGRWKRVDTSDLCPPGMVTFASCQTGQPSYESEKYHAGIFTAALVEAFSDVGRRDRRGSHRQDHACEPWAITPVVGTFTPGRLHGDVGTPFACPFVAPTYQSFSNGLFSMSELSCRSGGRRAAWPLPGYRRERR